MPVRLLKIAFLFAKLIASYILLLFTRKRAQSCLVHAHFEKSGGTRTYFFYLIEFLSKRKFEITVILSKKQCDEEIMEFRSKYFFTIQEINFELYRTKYQGTIFYKKNHEDLIYQLKELFFFWKYIRKYRCSWCIVSEANPEELLFLFLSPVRVLYILHTVASHRLDNLKKIMLNFCLSIKKQIITVSEYSKNIIEKNWITDNNAGFIRVIHNFYEPGTQNMPIHKNMGKIVLTIGTVADYKNPLFWIEVCKEILIQCKSDITFIWAGDGDLLEQCKNASLNIPQIKFVGYTKNVEQLYRDCSVYFQPSIFESHGIAVLGAMYFEKPCVVSDRQGLPESVINNKTGVIVSVENTHDSVEAILTLLNFPAKAIEFGKAGKKRVESNFSKNKWLDKMNFIFN